jgi:hypothetical protein
MINGKVLINSSKVKYNKMNEKKPKHYINNADFLEALIKYKEECDVAKAAEKEEPQISNYIGGCFLMIAEHLSRKPNFISYSFREEMISDGIENCLMYFRNFDPSKSKNPFAYFTQITYFAFLRRIMKEKKQLYVKYKATQQFGIMEDEYDEDTGTSRPFIIYDNISEFIQNFEESKKKKKDKSANKGIEKFIETEDILLEDIETISLEEVEAILKESEKSS